MMLNNHQENKLFILAVDCQPVAEVAAPNIEGALRCVLTEFPNIPHFDLASRELDKDFVCDVVIVHDVGGRDHKTVLSGMTMVEALTEAKKAVPIQKLRVLISDQYLMYNAPGAFPA